MTLHEKSLDTLELTAILDMLAAEAVCDAAKTAALALRPSADAQTVRTRLGETTAAKKMMVLRSSPPFSGVKDIRIAVSRADKSGMLNTRELLDVAALLRAAASTVLYSQHERVPEKTAIDYLFLSLITNKFLENKISTSILSEDEISDNASRELSDIRRHMRLAEEKVRHTLNKIITSPVHTKALQEPIITMRNGRYVVPVKAEHKPAVPGLVHDISSSGATQFIEPMAVVQINNELRELAAREKQEIERILMELSADVAEKKDDLITDFEVLAALDLIFAKAKYSYKLDAIEPDISDDTRVKLQKARHPLLPQGEAIPIDIRIGGEFDTLVITGPNTGGKTVSLKTLGLLCLMTLCGLHIPVAEGSCVPIFGAVLADIGDEQSIEQSLSTFSSHMKNIVGILAECESGCLILLDELGAGTDPVEGAALAMAIIEYARRRGALIAATTHYAELKTYAVTEPGVVNASCEFDVATLKPTYKLITGIPGKSNAFAISGRLGLPESVIEDAKNRVNTANAAFEDAVAGLEYARLDLERDKQKTDLLLRDASDAQRQAEEMRSRLDSEREKAMQLAKRDAEKIVSEARRAAENIIGELRELQRKAYEGEDQRIGNEQRADIFRKLNEAESSIGRTEPAEEEYEPSREIVPGDRVLLRGLGTPADVVSINADGVLSLQAGIMKITAKKDEVRLVEDEMKPEIKKHLAKSDGQLRSLEAKPELDLRGMLTDEAIPVLERFLDNARLAKLVSATVIHGKGTGAMRQAVHQYLKREQRGIKSFRLGRFGEGEDGVTIIEF